MAPDYLHLPSLNMHLFLLNIPKFPPGPLVVPRLLSALSARAQQVPLWVTTAPRDTYRYRR